MITKPGHENKPVLALVQIACPSISVYLLQALMICLKVNAINHPLQDQRPVCREGHKRCWKNLNIMARRRLMIVVKLQVRLMLSTSVIKISIHWCNPNCVFFFPLPVVNSRTWPWLCSLCGEKWGRAIIRLCEERFNRSWTHILNRGGSIVYWLGEKHLSIFLPEDIRKLCGFVQLNLWTLLAWIDIHMLHGWWWQHRWRAWKSQSEY